MNLACVTFAVIRLAMPFADGMVLQQGRPVPVWGTAETGSKVEVRVGEGLVRRAKLGWTK